MLLLALGSKARNGKDTAAEAVRDHYEKKRATHAKHYGWPSANLMPRVKIFKFAEPLYEECRTIHGMTEKDPALLQRIGHGRRQEDPLYWVKMCYSKILGDSELRGGIAIISDLRYRNEAEFIKDKGGVVVNVTRLNQDGTRYISPDRDPNHPSEIELDGYNWDYEIRTKSAVLTGEFAITLVEYLQGQL